MEDVYVVGVGMTPFGRHLDKSVKDLTRAAVSDALSDAGATQEDIGAAFFANATQSSIEGQLMVPGQIALRDMGFERTPIANVENACASASTAFHLAYAQIRAGMTDVALAVGVEKMYHEDKSKSFRVFDGAWDVSRADETAAGLKQISDDVPRPEDAQSDAEIRSVFMDIYAALAKFHMKTFGTTTRQIASASAKNHKNSVFNPLSQYRNDLSVDDVLAARMISWPLTLPMCSPISDGAAAAVLCNAGTVKRFGLSRAVKIHASVLGGGTNRAPEQYETQICRLAALRAYEMAGLGPNDMSVAEVHDASAFAEIQQSENLGFCEYGAGGWLAESGASAIGGRIPINPSGGLECKGHPIGATGLAQIYELVLQLRGEAGKRQVERARFGIAENGGGLYRFEEAVACITILGR